MDEFKNPNMYDDEGFTRCANDASSALVGLWEAGASTGDIEDLIANALANAGLPTGTLLTVEVG